MCAKVNEKLNYHYQGNMEEIVFFKMPKILFLGDEFQNLSMSAKLLYMLMLDRVSMSNKNNWVDKNNKVFIYYTQVEVMKKLNFSSKKVSNLFKELENFYSKNNGLIKRVKQGLRKPDLIYVKDLSSLEVKDTSFDGEFKYGRPNIENKIDVKSDEVLCLENKIKLLEKEVAKSNKALELKHKIENSINVINDVENSIYCDVENSIEVTNDVENLENTDLIVDLTCKNYKSRDVKNTTLDLSKVQRNNNNINKNNINYNKSFIPFRNEENTGRNERMNNKEFKLNVINEMYENKELPYGYTASEIKMNVAIKELVDYDITQTNYKNKSIDEFYFSTYKLFTNALIKMLTNKGNMTLNSQNVTYSKVYDKLTEYISFGENEFGEQYCHLNNLVDNAIDDYKKGSSKTEIKYPIKYMQSCIWNALEIGDIRINAKVNNIICDTITTNISKENQALPNTSYDLQKFDDLWSNFVPRLV